ncbi:MAG: RtcB family protein [Bacillota bacterium]
MNLVPIGQNRFKLLKKGNMQVEPVLFLSPAAAAEIAEPEALRQLADAASLPGVMGVLGMPDLHAGFGLPIGGVMANYLEDGVVSAGAVGMDINCGVRLLATNIPREQVSKPLVRSLMQAIEERIPTGVGKKSRHQALRRASLEDVAARGAALMVELGFGWPEDLEVIEENGAYPGADLTKVSREAVRRADQLSTIGGGNHFIEIGYVAEVYDAKVAEVFALQKDSLTVLIHTGSRGFGHQICTDYSQSMLAAAGKYKLVLPSKGLACAPISSREGQDYLAAMAAAVNFAFANRQVISHDVRDAFGHVLRCDPARLGLRVVYDVAHNIAKKEIHYGRQVLVHRKGATRALPPGHPDNPAKYRQVGHPALVPGSMGTASYVLVGTPLAKETYFSVNHGAGRVMSRSAARRQITSEEFHRSMGDILYNSRDPKKLLDEAPGAYKDIHSVVDTLAQIGITRKIAKLVPLGSIKGEGDD